MKIRIIPILAAMLALAGCSSTRTLQPGQSQLVNNVVVINGPADFTASQLSPYIRQQTGSSVRGWTPAIGIYNLSKGTGKGLSALFEKLGKAPTVFNPDLVESSRQNIGKHLEYLGYYGSKVDAAIFVEDGQKAYVRYSVTPGKRYMIDSVTFSLPDNPDFRRHFSEDSTAMLVKPGMWLSEALLENESARGAAVFRELGYYGFSKNNYFFVADTLTPGRCILDYSIKGYTRNDTPDESRPVSLYRFGKVDISHSADIPFRDNVLRRLNLIHPGMPYSEELVNRTYNRLATLRVFNGVAIELNPSDSAVVDCNIRLSESKVQGIKVNGEVSYSSSGLIGLSPQLSWYHKNIFHGGEWLNVGFSGNLQVRPSDNVKAMEFGVNSNLSIPRFLGLPESLFEGRNVPRTEVKLAYNFQNRPEFTRNIAKLSFGYNWQSGNCFYTVHPFRATFITLANTDPAFEQTLEHNPFLRDTYRSHLDAGLSAMFYHTTNTDLVPKTDYHYERLSFDISGNAISMFRKLMPLNEAGQAMFLGAPYTQYVRGETVLGRTFRIGSEDRSQIALRFDAGAGFAYGNSSALPFEEQFYCGGANSMRGWQARTLGPGDSTADGSFIIPSQTGDLKLELDMEYRFPIVWKLEGALFAEVGNVWKINELRNMYETIAADWGFGLRVNLDFIVARLDLGVKTYNPSLPAGARWIGPAQWIRPDALALHFGVGYPF